MLKLKGVSKCYRDSIALQYPTDLNINPQEVTTLIGPSGCGKSTLLRIMIGLTQPDNGTVLFEGIPLTGNNILQLRRRMGYVIQEGGLFPHLTAQDNIALMAEHLGWETSRISSRIAELIPFTHLSKNVLERYPMQLSGGERQRVALMRALMLDPEVLLLDEPLGALDPMTRYEMQTDLKEIFRSLKKTVVMVTHDLIEAAFFSDTIVLLQKGRIVQEGDLKEIVTNPAEPFVKHFFQAQRSPLEVLEGVDL